ncbi:hypothetical protein ES703_34595 [subsurface metagenome]
MIFQFDFARLERFQRESLLKILDVIQSENVGEIVVEAVKLPYVFLVLADDTVEVLWGLECEGVACRVCQNLTPNRSRGQIPKRIRKRLLNRNRSRSRSNRNRNHRMPVKVARFVSAGRTVR